MPPCVRNSTNFAKAVEKGPPGTHPSLEEGIEEVRKSGVTDRALKVGDHAPEFELAKPPEKGEALGAGPEVPSSYVVSRGLVPLLQHRLAGLPEVCRRWGRGADS